MKSNDVDVKAQGLAVALFVYRRPHHTQKVLSSLAKCRGSNFVDLTIFSDGQRDLASQDSVREVREVCQDFQGAFRSATIYESETNLGLASSVIQGVSEVLKKHGDLAVLEDDTEVSPTFVEYMRLMLDNYRLDPGVMSISGYQFPPRTVPIPRNFHWDAYLSARCSSWGWGTWRDRWVTAEWDTTKLLEEIQEPKHADFLAEAGGDFMSMLKQQDRGDIDSWAVRFGASHIIQGRRCVYPRKTLIRNLGLDGSGEHCSELTWLRHHNLESWLPEKLPPSSLVDDGLSRQPGRAFSGDSSRLARLQRKLQRARAKMT